MTLNNMVILVAGVIALSWAWGSVMAMQKNYELQQELDLKNRDKLVAEIQYKTLQYEQKYIQSSEYQEIAARDKLGLVKPGVLLNRLTVVNLIALALKPKIATLVSG